MGGTRGSGVGGSVGGSVVGGSVVGWRRYWVRGSGGGGSGRKRLWWLRRLWWMVAEAAVWKDAGGCMEGCWWLYGRMLAAMKEGRYVERWRLRYRLFVCLNFVLYGFEKSLFLFQMQCYLN